MSSGRAHLLTCHQLFRQFDFQLVNVLNPVTSINFNLFMQSDMWVHVTERKPPSVSTTKEKTGTRYCS